MMYSVQSRWEAVLQRRTAVAYYMYGVWLKSSEGRSKSCRKGDTMLRPQQVAALSKATSSSMTTDSIWTCLQEMKKAVMWSLNSGDVLAMSSYRNVESYMALFQLFSDKTAISLKNTVLAAYPVHAIFLMCPHKKGIVDWKWTYGDAIPSSMSYLETTGWRRN